VVDEDAVPGNAELAKVLFAPLSIGPVTLANRIVMSPMAALEALPDGRPSEQTIAFFRERAKGGVGLIIQGASSATRRGYEESPVKGALRFDDDRFVPDLKRVTEAVHAHGIPIFAEIAPGLGTMAKPSAAWPVIAASPKNVVLKADPEFAAKIRDGRPGDIVRCDRNNQLERMVQGAELASGELFG
jgi:2,4-dienoyl-CoA reductase-like NADH-dependent reductase (Old Yellow Enzyme family)